MQVAGDLLDTRFVCKAERAALTLMDICVVAEGSRFWSKKGRELMAARMFPHHYTTKKLDSPINRDPYHVS